MVFNMRIQLITEGTNLFLNFILKSKDFGNTVTFASYKSIRCNTVLYKKNVFGDLTLMKKEKKYIYNLQVAIWSPFVVKECIGASWKLCFKVKFSLFKGILIFLLNFISNCTVIS